MNRLQRWWLRRRHGQGRWAALFDDPPAREWVSLDLETTGLDRRSDAILSLAAVPVRAGRVVLSERFERLVHPGRDFDIESIRHHHITPAEVAACADAHAVVGEFLHWLGPRRLLGHHLWFDLGMLAPVVRALTGYDLPNPAIDVAAVYERRARLARPHGDIELSLDVIANELGIPVLQRHTALGDACTTALIWLALQRDA